MTVTSDRWPVFVDRMRPDDWAAVREIYAEGIATNQATFETEVPEWEAWDASHLAEPRLVARENGAVVGWAALSPVSRRAVYRGVAEVSVYVADRARGRGIGDKLLEALIENATGIWTLQASIFPENEASVRLHQKHGFRVVGRREKIAQQHGIWRDTLLLERRESRTTPAGCGTSQ